MMTPAQDAAITGFGEGRLSCSQAVLSAFSQQLGLTQGLAFKLATPFGGGMARSGQICGAVSAALMVIGLARAAADPEDKETKDLVYEKTQQFIRWFERAHGSLYCPDLIGCDLGCEEGSARAQALEVSQKICVPLVLAVINVLPDYCQTLREFEPA